MGRLWHDLDVRCFHIPLIPGYQSGGGVSLLGNPDHAGQTVDYNLTAFCFLSLETIFILLSQINCVADLMKN